MRLDTLVFFLFVGMFCVIYLITENQKIDSKLKIEKAEAGYQKKRADSLQTLLNARDTVFFDELSRRHG